ncbi:serine hydrolase domain-containing protein [Larkinella harenae]
MDKALRTIHKKSNFPGFAIAVVKKDSLCFSNSYGYADKRKKKPYTLETIQPVGSVSKTFIGLAVMKSIELGYFDLETRINDLLPFQISNPTFPNDPIKVKHLVTHTSSLLDDEQTYYKVAYQLGHTPTIELGDFLLNYYTPNGRYYAPTNFDDKKIGTNYAYSNIASALMAYIIEVQSKMPFAAFTQKYIFQPLSMDRTDWFYQARYEDQYATLYQVNTPENSLERKLVNPDKSLKAYSCVTYPDGSLRTSVKDLTRYVLELMNGYFTGEALILSKDAYQTLFAKQFTEQARPANVEPQEPNRAVFWAYSKNGGIRHTGSDPGVFAFISINPSTQIGRIMTLNASLDGKDNRKTIGYFREIINAMDQFENTLK